MLLQLKNQSSEMAVEIILLFQVMFRTGVANETSEGTLLFQLYLPNSNKEVDDVLLSGIVQP